MVLGMNSVSVCQASALSLNDTPCSLFVSHGLQTHIVQGTVDSGGKISRTCEGKTTLSIMLHSSWIWEEEGLRMQAGEAAHEQSLARQEVLRD